MVLLKQNCILINSILREYWSEVVPELKGGGGGVIPSLDPPLPTTASKPNIFYVDHLTFVRLSSCYLFIYLLKFNYTDDQNEQKQRIKSIYKYKKEISGLFGQLIHNSRFLILNKLPEIR